MMVTPTISLIILVVLSLQRVDSCFLGLKPPLESPKILPPRQSLSGQIIVPAYSFTCSGTISSWEAKVSGIPSRIHFQVWRLIPELQFYHLAGHNIVNAQDIAEDPEVSFSGDRLQLSVTDPLKQIHVLPGDIIGVFIGGEGNMKISYRMSQNTTTYVADFQAPLNGLVSPLIMDPAFDHVLMRVAPEINLKVEGES